MRLPTGNPQRLILFQLGSTVARQTNTIIGQTVSQLNTHIITGVTELSEIAAQWDALWQISPTCQPTTRAALVQHWCKSFANSENFSAITVRDDHKLLAALPLVPNNLMGIFPAYSLPTNCWCNAGDLLIAPTADPVAICNCLIRGLGSLDRPFIVFDEVEINSDRWQAFVTALRSMGKQHRITTGTTAGVVNILHDWPAYQKSWSSNHRHAVKKSIRRLEGEGKLAVERIQHPTSDLDCLLKECFAIEDRGWKGAEGTSVLKTTGMLDFMQKEAALVAAAGSLDLWLLRLDGRLIAFEYCHFSKGTCFSHKISFDPAFKKFGPGRILRYFQLESLHQDQQAKKLDMLGHLCNSKAKWATSSYTTGRIMAAVGRSYSGLVVQGIKTSAPVVQGLRRAKNVQGAKPELGAKRLFEFAKCIDQGPPESDASGLAADGSTRA